MNEKLKKMGRPLVRLGLDLAERLTSFRTDPTGFLPNRLRMLTGSYERFLIDSILLHLPADGVFVDVGANVGYVSKKIAQERPKAKSIIAVEPNSRLLPVLKYNLAKYSNCNILNMGLGSKEDNLEFYHGKDSCVGSFIKGYNEMHHSNNPAYTVSITKVPVQVGDIVFSELPSIDVMKVDVEGFELEVFKGFKAMIEKKSIKNIVFEYRPLSQHMSGLPKEAIINYLSDHYYKIYGLEDKWKGIEINNQNVNLLIQSLGDNGYTTLHATFK